MSMQKVARDDFQRQIFQEWKELEEHKTNEALELVRRQHKLVKLEGERERARMIDTGDGAVRGYRSFFRSLGQFFIWFLLNLLGF